MRAFKTPTTMKLVNYLFGNDGDCQVITWSNDYTMAKKISDTLNVPFNSLCGVYDTEEKMITIMVEIMRDESVKPKDLAKKYNINKNYMLKRLRELDDRLPGDPLLKMKVLQVMLVLKMI